MVENSHEALSSGFWNPTLFDQVSQLNEAYRRHLNYLTSVVVWSNVLKAEGDKRGSSVEIPQQGMCIDGNRSHSDVAPREVLPHLCLVFFYLFRGQSNAEI